MAAPMTAAQVRQLDKASPLNDAVNLGQRLRNAETLQSTGRVASGHVRIATNPNDTDTLTVSVGAVTVNGVTTPGLSVVFEYEVSGGITAGRTAIPRGATAALTATATAAALNATLGLQLRATAHATDTTVVDVVCQQPGATLTLATNSGGRVLVQDNGQEVAPSQQTIYTWRRTVTAEDVTRGRLLVHTGLSGGVYYTARFINAVGAILDYNGTATETGGVISLAQGTAGGVWAAGNFVEIFAIGLIT